MPAVDPLPQYCPSCGGPNPGAVAGAPCQFCTAPVVPVGTPDPRTSLRCSSCATLVGGGASFCSSCGNALAEQPTGQSPFVCPGCEHQGMQVFGLAPTVEQPQGHPVHGCPRCGGAWVDCQSMQTILAGASAHAPMAGHGTGDHGVRRRRIASGHFSKKIVYRPCPACGHRMMRKNFARVSGIIVDECGPHGSFFDAGELEGVIEFVRSGGLHLAQRKDADEQARLRKTSLTAAAMRAEADAYPGMFGQPVGPAPSDTLAFTGFLGWAGRWLRRTFD